MEYSAIFISVHLSLGLLIHSTLAFALTLRCHCKGYHKLRIVLYGNLTIEFPCLLIKKDSRVEFDNQNGNTSPAQLGPHGFIDCLFGGYSSCKVKNWISLPTSQFLSVSWCEDFAYPTQEGVILKSHLSTLVIQTRANSHTSWSLLVRFSPSEQTI